MKVLPPYPSEFSRWADACRLLLQYGRAHRRVFLLGAVMAVLVIGLRLVLPWIFVAFLKPWLDGGPVSIVEQTKPVLFFAATLAFGLSLMGYADHKERLWFARFAIQTVNDLRRAALAAAGQRINAPECEGDLLSRLIGDSARIKNGLQTFLIHVATNSSLCLGVTLVMLFTNPIFGAVFLMGLLLMIAAAFQGAMRIYAVSIRHRAAEGRLANSLQRDDLAEALDRFSGEKESTVNRIQGRTTWIVHTLFGLALLGCVMVGLYEQRAGRLTGHEVVIITVYAWMLRAPVVRLARQGARTGKIVACIERFAELLTTPEAEAASPVPLENTIQLKDIRISSSGETGRRRRLRIDSLEFQIGQRVAVLGKPGAGKSTLLNALAQRGGGVDFVPHDSRWRRQSLRSYLGIEGTGEESIRNALRASRAEAVIGRLPGGLSAVVGSHDLSSYERQALGLARGLLSNIPVLLLDDPIRGLSDEQGTKMLTRIMAFQPRRTIVMALGRPLALGMFDRVIQLKRGRVKFDGTPQQWSERIEARRVLRAGTAAASPKQAIILAAGCGRRYGHGLPKTLLPIGGRTLLEHQIQILRRHGVENICVVVGHGAERVRGVGGNRCDYIENLRPETTNSLYSLWLARNWISGSFVLLNADVLAHPEIYRRVMAADGTALAYDSTSGKEDEHMKVRLVGERLEKISKDLTHSDASGESVGLLKFSDSAAPLLFEEVERLIAGGGEVLPAPAAVDRLATRLAVRCIDIAGLPWAEIDFPEDLRVAQERVWPLIA